jgi:S-adenosylmethionine:tRNA ribosyltransferase-isomerase
VDATIGVAIHRATVFASAMACVERAERSSSAPMDVADLDFELPEELIAQAPLPERDASRLLVIDANASGLVDARFVDLPSMLPPSLFVVNDTRVLPARLHGHKPSGGALELLLVERLAVEASGAERWLALGRTSKGLKVGSTARFAELEGEILEKRDEGYVVVRLVADREAGDVAEALERAGQMPLPPYVKRAPDASDRERYQTIFARETGSVAAPTASLHFTPRVVAAMEAAGHTFAELTLHVGPGTFRPVKAERLEDHVMHEERFAVSEACAAAIDAARREGRAVVAVGTTVTRTLESVADGDRVRPGEGRTGIFLRPPYQAKVVDHLVTNFHLPRSTLMALVYALGGEATMRAAYAHAVRERYRFFSYGDASLIRGIRG